MSSDQSSYKIDPNSRLEGTNKRSLLSPVKRPNKDFKDFLNIKKGQDDSEMNGKSMSGKKKGKFEDELLASNALGSSDQSALSLFDLSAGNSKGDNIGTVTVQATDSEQPTGSVTLATDQLTNRGSTQDATAQQQTQQQASPTSLFDLASSPSSTQRKVTVNDSGAVVNPGDPRAAAVLKTKKNENTQFVEEKPDLASIASQQKITIPTEAPIFAQADTSTPASKLDAKTLQQIIDQIVDKIYVVKEAGRSDTTIILKNPPLFDGVKVTLTSYESASGQYNITFENLTQMAKNVLDLRANQDALKQALTDKGVVIQMFTTTTSTIAAAPHVPWDGARDQESSQQGSGQGQKQQDDAQENS